MDAEKITPLSLRHYPDEILKIPCEKVEVFDEDLEILVANMFATMYMYNGIGLAANQIGVSKQIIVMDTTVSGQGRHVLINPKILATHETFGRFQEGCLSFPGIHAFVKRPIEVLVEAQDQTGQIFSKLFTGIEAVCIQHEMDHLIGVTFYDHLSDVQKNLIKKKIKNLKDHGNMP